MALQAGRVGVSPDHVDERGNIEFPVVPNATKSVKGIVKVGDNINVSSGTISVPKASNNTLGVVKAGTNITISSDGSINASGGGATFGTFTATNGTCMGYTITQNGNNVSLIMTYLVPAMPTGGTNTILGTISGVSFPSGGPTQIGTGFASKGENFPVAQIRVYITSQGVLSLDNRSGQVWYDGDWAFFYGCWKV